MGKLGAKVLKIIIIVAIIFSLILGIAYTVTFKMEYKKLQKQARDSVTKVLEHVDMTKLEKVISQRDTQSQDYIEIRDSLLGAKAFHDLKFVYIMGKKDDKNAFYIMDIAEEPEEYGKEYPIEGAMKKAFDGEITYDKEPTKDDWGYFISGYAPLKNSSGEVVAILGVDMDVTSFQSIKNGLILGFSAAIVSGFALSILICFLFSKEISKNINKVKNNLELMSTGDLKHELNIKSKDELGAIGDSINDFRTKISQIIENVKDMSIKVDEISSGITSSTEEVNASIEEITASVEDISSSMQTQSQTSSQAVEIVEGLGDNITNTRQEVKIIYDLSRDSKKLNCNQLESMEDMMSAYNKSEGISREVSKKVALLQERAEQIGSITNIITSIAEQTSLLALNAAIEAARAGDSGRGFAVVADEVRNLADQSAKSANEISELIQNIQNTIEDAANNIELSKKSSEIQYDTILKFKEEFQKLFENINSIISRIEIVDSSMEEVYDSKNAVIDSINSINTMLNKDVIMLKRITESIEEQNESINSVAENMNKLVEDSSVLNDIVNIFKI